MIQASTVIVPNELMYQYRAFQFRPQTRIVRGNPAREEFVGIGWLKFCRTRRLIQEQ